MTFNIDLNEIGIPWNLISESINPNNSSDRLIIKKYKNHLNWANISKASTLKESFIREYSDYVIWPLIVIYQDLSHKLICDFEDRINFNILSRNHNLHNDTIKKYFNRLDLNRVVSGNFNIDEITFELITPHLNDDNWIHLQSKSFNSSFKRKHAYMFDGDEKRKDNGFSDYHDMEKYVLQHRCKNEDDFICVFPAVEINRTDEFEEETKHIKYENDDMDKHLQFMFSVEDFMANKDAKKLKWYMRRSCRTDVPNEKFISHRDFIITYGVGINNFIEHNKSTLSSQHRGLFELLKKTKLRYNSIEERNDAQIRLRNAIEIKLINTYNQHLYCDRCGEEEITHNHYICGECGLVSLCELCFSNEVPNTHGYSCPHDKSQFIHGDSIDNFHIVTHEIWFKSRGKMGNEFYNRCFK